MLRKCQISLDDDDIDSLREHAIANRTSSSRVVRDLIRQHINRAPPPIPKPVVLPYPDNPRAPRVTKPTRYDYDALKIVEYIRNSTRCSFHEAVNFLIRRAAQNPGNKVT
jgi:hypothetical protein